MGSSHEQAQAVPEQPTEGIRRRALLKRILKRTRRVAVVTGGVAVLDGVNLALQQALIPDIVPPIREIEFEDFRMKNNHLRVVMTEHHEQDWVAKQDQIEREIVDADIVIPEYRPREYAHLQNGGPLSYVISQRDEKNGLFNHVDDLCTQFIKPVWVVDPYHNEQGAFFRLELFSPSFLAQVGALLSIDVSLQKYQTLEINRRQLIIRSLITLGLGAGVVGLNLAYLNDFENDLRHVVSAELLERVDEQENDSDSPKRMTMIIPKGHWESDENVNGIKFYLEHPEERKERLEKYKWMFEAQFSSFFEARHYEGGNGSGTPDSKIKLIA